VRTGAFQSRISIVKCVASVVGALGISAIVPVAQITFAGAGAADLAVTKSVSNPAPSVGDAVTFTITLTNNGPDLAGGVAVTDQLPAGLTFVSATPSQGTYEAGSGFWVVGTMAAGSTTTLTIQAQVVAPGTHTNRATITGSQVADPNTANNSASAAVTATGPPASTTTTVPAAADLAVTKTVDNATPPVGGVVTFTVTLTNNGPAAAGTAATPVAVTDLLPATLTFVSATPSQGTYGSASGFWIVGVLGPGASGTLQIVAEVTAAGAHSNTATVTGSNLPDVVSTNNSASVTVTATQGAVTSTLAPSTTATAPTVAPPLPAPPPAPAATLPSTGFDGVAIAVVATVLVGAGVMLTAMLRRRPESS
jgi:uncharacterized repeat protein (TIGR01451 family)